VGIRLTLHAVDRLPLARFLEQPVADVARFYAREGSDPGRALHIVGQQMCHAIPGDRPAEVQRLPDDPVLAMPMGDYLNAGTTGGLANLLGCLSTCRAAGFVEELSRGYRRWWIGSVLDAGQQSRCFPRDEFTAVACLFERLLGPHDCGFKMPWCPAAGPSLLPVQPGADADLWMACWDDLEWRRVVEFVDILLAIPNRRFHAPPGPVGAGPSTDREWDDWARQMLDAVMVTDRLGFGEPLLVSFIG